VSLPATDVRAGLRAAVVLLSALAAASCAGLGPGATGPGAPPAPPAPKAAAVPQVSSADAALQKTVALISSATPASLAAARWAAADARKAGAADAGAADAMADALLRGLYPAAGDTAATGASAAAPLAGMRINDPYLQRIAPAVGLLDPHTVVDESRAAGLNRNLAEAAALRPDSPLAPYLSGLLLQRRSAPLEKTRAPFEEALRRVPAFAPAAARLLDTIISSGTAPKELPLLRRLAAVAPTAAERYETLARAELAGGQPLAAADAAARGLMGSPDDESGAAWRVRFAMLRAEALEAAGDWYQSLSVLQALLKLQPGLPEAALARARILHEKAQNDTDALAVLADGEARNPRDAAFPEMRARILLDDNRTEEAVTALRHAVEIDPGRVDALTLLVSVSVKTGSWDDAASWLEKIPEAARGPEQRLLAWKVATGRGDHAKALAEAKRLFEATGSVDSLALEARSMIAADRPADALVAIDHALKAMQPAALQASEMHYLRSRAGSDDPLRDLRTALRENPDNLEALEAISDSLAAQKDYRKAAEYARRASVLDPSNADLARKAGDLAKLASE
jgi:tetratricopeptide (TPR) repeat protein